MVGGGDDHARYLLAQDGGYVVRFAARVAFARRWPLSTRDTVDGETPAARATS
ncbi:hypothetical protein EV192_10844 [Actinocrispum wychmicini]|uniref:Uncharacterized protein n=1 Tax=Actinocrispum wychmicini TaxID=1213861 RepID=A0A4R2JD54_9PSEU|nr:hypothetical protein EV192_10844 [Actinocrispum wychmicini]